jgi:hypothetical protein
MLWCGNAGENKCAVLRALRVYGVRRTVACARLHMAQVV